MADYNEILDAELEPEKPVTSSLMTRLRDNAIAIAEGASGAPEINGAALTDATVAAAKLVETSAETTWVLGRTAGAAAGAVGTYAMLAHANLEGLETVDPGGVVAGSNLRFSNAAGTGSQVPGGTFRLMGFVAAGTEASRTSVWLRIS